MTYDHVSIKSLSEEYPLCAKAELIFGYELHVGPYISCRHVEELLANMAVEKELLLAELDFLRKKLKASSLQCSDASGSHESADAGYSSEKSGPLGDTRF